MRARSEVGIASLVGTCVRARDSDRRTRMTNDVIF